MEKKKDERQTTEQRATILEFTSYANKYVFLNMYCCSLSIEVSATCMSITKIAYIVYSHSFIFTHSLSLSLFLSQTHAHRNRFSSLSHSPSITPPHPTPRDARALPQSHVMPNPPIISPTSTPGPPGTRLLHLLSRSLSKTHLGYP